MSGKQFSEATHLSDAILVVEAKQLHVNKAVLSLASPVFDRMFNGAFKEGTATEIPLPGKKYHDMVQFLSCIYPSSETTVTPRNMDIIMPLADEYQVSFIKERCDALIETMLLKQQPTTSILVHLMYIAGKYRLRKSMVKCADLASSLKFTELHACEEFEHIDPEMKYQLSSLRLLRYEEGCDDVYEELKVLDVEDITDDMCDHDKPKIFKICKKCKREKEKDIMKKMKKFHKWNPL